MPVQKRLAQVGIKRQTAKGTLQTQPALVFGLTSGAVAGADVSEGDLSLTWGSGRLPEGFERTELKPGMSFETVATPRLTSYLMQLALGSDVVTNPTNGQLVGTLNSPAAAGATSIVVGIGGGGLGAGAIGQVVKIDARGGNLVEYRTVSATSGAGPYTLTVPALSFAHATGAVVRSVPYTHTETPADDLAYSTLFGKLGSTFWNLGDAKLDELEMTFDKLGAARLRAKFMGCTVDPIASAWTADADSDERVAFGYFNASGQPFSIDGLTSAAVSGSVKFTNHLTPVMTAFQATPTDVMPGYLELAFSLRVIPDDFLLWRKVITGSAAGVDEVSVPYYGALSFKWGMSQYEDVTVVSPRAKLLTTFPDADPAGGPSEIQLEARVGIALSGAGVTSTVRNDSSLA